ncbi:MAG TPA: HemK/PrmC family methyltransferase [Candidatus Saccharimonadales bacterium]|nr:HemK/PrmC family methyltransferase [Candidatus Saccharimonadales bacterium]
MQAETWLAEATKKLEKAGIGTARLDCLVLLEDVLDKDRAYLLAHSDIELSEPTLKKLNRQIIRRVKHEPLAYIRGKTEFYGREFCIDHRVLEPRPESETMIELLKKLKLGNQTIADIGTGSGALAITVKLEFPKVKVVAGDIDKDCLVVAKRNARLLQAKVEFYQGDLLKPLPMVNIILANLPYVPNNHTINQAARHEPNIAIFGGPDGLDIYRQMFAQIHQKPSYILTESLPPQHQKLAQIAKRHGFIQKLEEDFIQVLSKTI